MNSAGGTYPRWVDLGGSPPLKKYSPGSPLPLRLPTPVFITLTQDPPMVHVYRSTIDYQCPPANGPARPGDTVAMELTYRPGESSPSGLYHISGVLCGFCNISHGPAGETLFAWPVPSCSLVNGLREGVYHRDLCA